MNFKNFELNANNHFVAMEYYGLIFNRTFLILLTGDQIIGIKVNGLVSVEGGVNKATREIVDTMTIKGNLQNPYSFMNQKYLEQVQNCELLDGSILTQDKSNFIINRKDIKDVYYDSKKKWGMGYYPHDGKVYLKTNDGRKREFIILGNQSGQRIANLILLK